MTRESRPFVAADSAIPKATPVKELSVTTQAPTLIVKGSQQPKAVPPPTKSAAPPSKDH